MTDAHANAVEAAAMAVFDRMRSDARVPILNTWDVLRSEHPDSRLYTSTMQHAQTAITAYLATMAEAGWVMVRDVAEHDTDVHGNPYSGYRDGEGSIEYAYSNGWNDCRAKMLKGATDEQG